MIENIQSLLDRLIGKYGKYIECDRSTKIKLFLELVEGNENMERIRKTIDDIANGTLPENEFYHAIIGVNPWICTLSDQLSTIFSIVHNSDFDESGGVDAKELDK